MDCDDDMVPKMIRLLNSNLISSDAVLLSLCISLGFNSSLDDGLCILLKEVLKRGATPSIVLDGGKTPFDYACANNRSYDFLKTLAYAGCWFNPALEYRDSNEIRRLKKSKEDCSVAVIIFCALSKRTGAIHKDLRNPIASMIWEKRFG